MKRVVKWGLVGSLAIIAILYASFILFFKWSNYQSEVREGLDKSVYVNSREEHTIIPLHEGPASLAKRIQIIEEATETIELEFFIYDLDLASKIITKKLIKKAQEGVKIRILVDFSFPVVKLMPIYAHFLEQKGIKVKYYNVNAFNEIFTLQHRSHRKLLIVDDKRFITGGRNIANDYFNLSEEYNFLDSDLFIEGPISTKVRESFDMYWNSVFANSSKLETQISKDELKRAIEFSAISPEDEKLFKEIDQYKATIQKHEEVFQCKDVTFVTDFPGVSINNRRVYQTLETLLATAKDRIIAESPYFVLREDGLNLIDSLTKSDLNLTVLTNGLYATDAYYTVSALYPVLEDLSSTKISLYAYNGSAPKIKYKLPVKTSSRWGIHSKRAVLDGKTSIVGTYNVDPRSANLNSELIIVCKDNEKLAKNIEDDINLRLKSSYPIVRNNKVFSDNIFSKTTFEQKLKFYLVLPLASLFDFLL